MLVESIGCFLVSDLELRLGVEWLELDFKGGVEGALP